MFELLKEDILNILEKTPKHQYNESTSGYYDVAAKIEAYQDKGGSGKLLYSFLSDLYKEYEDKEWEARYETVASLMLALMPQFASSLIYFEDLYNYWDNPLKE